jgi:hypothetical protein
MREESILIINIQSWVIRELSEQLSAFQPMRMNLEHINYGST